MEAEKISERDTHSLDSVSERYELRSILGRGAFSAVYLAEDVHKHRPVVIKLLAESADSETAIARFRAEVATTRLLQHKNIVRVLGDGVTGDNRPYLVTEWIAGRSLAAVLGESGPLTTARAIDVALGIASALTYVHSRGLVHRDLKPSNILIPGWPDAPVYRRAMLLDFGVAGRLEQGRTQAGMIFGTLRYMSPEQIRGEQQSAATDVYGFGLLLFEMLTGRAPAKRTGDLATLLIAIRDGIPAEELAAVEPELADLIRRCVNSDPAQRPAMIAVLSELKNSLHRFKEDFVGGPIKATMDVPAAGGEPLRPVAAQSQSPVQRLPGSTLVLSAEPAAEPIAVRPGSPHASRVAPVAGKAGRWLVWTAVAAAAAVISIVLILSFRISVPTGNGPKKVITAPDITHGSPNGLQAGPSATNVAPGGSNEAIIRGIRFTAGLLLMGASIAIGFSLRTWLGSRSQVKAQAYELVFGAKVRTDLTATIALQLNELVSKLRKLDERILAGSVALMLNEYGSATDPKDRQAALMNVVALSEKLAVRLSPWYERYKEVIASAVAVMGGVSGLVTALNSVLGHKH